MPETLYTSQFMAFFTFITVEDGIILHYYLGHFCLLLDLKNFLDVNHIHSEYFMKII